MHNEGKLLRVSNSANRNTLRQIHIYKNHGKLLMKKSTIVIQFGSRN